MNDPLAGRKIISESFVCKRIELLSAKLGENRTEIRELFCSAVHFMHNGL